ncbi:MULTISPECIES: YidB family protein [unclassified Serratia (in: enterobacteria)]|uniref:YidB family protein n=1 Tax=unclassified Serratia (in: enterobacteria) TaxID=2647522 RepID=UPI003B43CDAC
MGILSSIVGQFFPGGEGHLNLVAFLSWVQDAGGVPTLLARLKTLEEGEGLTAENLTHENISTLFSEGELSSLAQRMGLSRPDVMDWISAHLPAVLQHLSPETHQLGGSNMLDVALSILRERLK